MPTFTPDSMLRAPRGLISDDLRAICLDLIADQKKVLDFPEEVYQSFRRVAILTGISEDDFAQLDWARKGCPPISAGDRDSTCISAESSIGLGSE